MAEIDKLLDHNYDGIEEYDNALPMWWIALFIITLLFGVYYVVHYHILGTGLLQYDRLAVEMEEWNAQQAALEAKEAKSSVSEEMLLALATDETALAVGKEVFATKCVACHLDKGQGLVGPNLTDDHWIHGGTIMEIRELVREGVPAKGMLTWKTILKDDELNSVVAYIWTLHGTNPPNAKAPEGELYVRQ